MEKDCAGTVTYIDNKGYVYCTVHGCMRRSIRPCRRLTPAELERLENGLTISYTPKAVDEPSVAPFADMPESAKRNRALDRWRKS